MSEPLAYFITFRCYGTWLHGDDRGSMDRSTNSFGQPPLSPNALRQQYERQLMTGVPQELDEPRRKSVNRAMREVAEHRGWSLIALAVRTNHVHVVIAANDWGPDRVMNNLKAYATRRLRADGLVGEQERIWSRHGSTKLLWRDEEVERTAAYVVEGQGSAL